MKQVKCPYCGNIQEATYDKRTADLEVAEVLFKMLDCECVTSRECAKCKEGFIEENNKVEE